MNSENEEGVLGHEEGEGQGGGELTAPLGSTYHALHPRSFKLRFASQRELGRSYVSLVKPLNLPSTVTGKFYCIEEPSKVNEECVRRASERIQDMFDLGPRDKYHAPVTTSQVYGWYEQSPEAATVHSDRRLSHHIRDSAWLRTRLALLAHDQKLKLK